MSNNKIHHSRAVTPNPRELPRSNPHSDKSKGRNYESLYEKILSRGYPPVAKKASNNVVSKRSKSPRRNIRENNKQTQKLNKQHNLSQNSYLHDKFEGRRSETQFMDISQKSRKLREDCNPKSANIFIENFYRDSEDSIYIDMFNAHEELKKLMQDENLQEQDQRKIDLNYRALMESKQADLRYNSRYGDNSKQNGYQRAARERSSYLLAEQQHQHSRNSIIRLKNNISSENNNGYWKYKQLMKSLESFNTSPPRSQVQDENAHSNMPTKNYNMSEYARCTYNQSFHNNKSLSNNDYVSSIEKFNYKNDAQDHIRKLILHTPKSKENSANKSTTVTSLLNDFPGQSIQNYESISQQLFDEKRYSNEKFTPKRYTNANLAENSLSQIGKSYQTSYDKNHEDLSYPHQSRNTADALNINRDSLLSSLSKSDNFGIDGKGPSSSLLGRPRDSANLAPIMIQDPIPSENVVMIKDAGPFWDIKSNTASDSNRITVKLSSDAVENASERSNYEYRYHPNRDVDKIIEKSCQNKRRINLSMRRSRSSFEKSHSLHSDESRESENYHKNHNQNAQALDTLKSKLDKTTSSSNYHFGYNPESATSKDTPHSTTFNSEYNSQQSISIKSNERIKSSECQPDINKLEQQSNIVYYKPPAEKSIEDKSADTSIVKISYAHAGNRQTTRTENFIQEKNTSQAGTHINVAELLSATDQSQQLLHQKSSHRSTKPAHTSSQRNQSSNVSTYSNYTEVSKTDQDAQVSDHIRRHRAPVQIKLHPMIRSKSEAEVKKHANLSKEGKNEFLSNLKNFSGSLVRSTKNFLTNKLALSDARLKCACSSNLGKDDTCELAMGWLMTQYKSSELPYLKKIYEKLQAESDLDVRNKKQIRLDISRTFPECKYYSSEGGGQHELQRVLECFARYDPQIGYVQGINFVAGNFLYHAEEYVAFWLLVMIFEQFEMRDIYQSSKNTLFLHYPQLSLERSSRPDEACTNH